MKFDIQKWKSNEILRKTSEVIGKQEIKKFASIWDEMIKFLKNPKNNWVWLAAPQIWINKRLISVSLLKDYEDKNFKTIMMINPEIFEYSEETCIDNEGCLSVPRVFWDVERYISIKVKFLDSKWKENILKLEWISARIVQHEMDHLEWILFTDKIIKKEK